MPTPPPDITGRRVTLATLLLLTILGTCPNALAQALPSENPEAELQQTPLHQAQEALQRAEFERLRPLMAPFVDRDTFLALPDEERARARSIYALGLYFDAQSSSDAEAQELLTHARAQLQVAVIEDPRYTLDPLVFPADLVELQRVLLSRLPLRLPGDAPGHHEDDALIYVERRITRRSPWVALLPAGAGQFQNGDVGRGVLLGATQLLGLSANIVGYWGVEAQRDAGGRISADAYEHARRWRTLQWSGLALAALGWGISIADAWINLSPEDVALRTLDDAPPELRSDR